MPLAGDSLHPGIFGETHFVGLLKKRIPSHSNCQWHLALLVMDVYQNGLIVQSSVVTEKSERTILFPYCYYWRGIV